MVSQVLGETAAWIQRGSYQMLVFFFCSGNVVGPNGHVLAINHAARWAGMEPEFLLAHQYSIPAEDGVRLRSPRAVSSKARANCLYMCVVYRLTAFSWVSFGRTRGLEVLRVF